MVRSKLASLSQPVCQQNNMKPEPLFYTRLTEALRELKKRNKNSELIKKVKETMGDAYPDWMPDEPCLFFCRNIITPNKETLYFLDLAKDIGLPVVFLEYYDKFVAVNKTKYHLGLIRTEEKKKVIIDFNDEGKKIDTIKTLKGESLVEFHHNLARKHIKDFDSYKIINITKWFNNTRNTKVYYFNYFSLFVAHGILFENFLLEDREEKKFLDTKLIPSIEKIKEFYGCIPLIYPLLPFEFEGENSWLFYPKEVYTTNNNG